MAGPRSAKKGGSRPDRRKAQEPEELPSDLEMEADRHAKQQDKLLLNVHDEAELDDDSLDEEEVLGLEGSEEDSDWDSEDDTKLGRSE